MRNEVIALIAGSILVTGCVPGVLVKDAVNKYDAAADQVRLGEQENKVLALLEPTQSHLLPDQKKRPEKLLLNGKRIDIYFFRSAWYPDGLTTDDEFTPYIFVNARLAAVGWSVLGGPPTHAQSPSYVDAPTFVLPSLMGQTGIRQQVQQEVEQQFIQRQILNHGAGGCTPNFSTGGCL